MSSRIGHLYLANVRAACAADKLQHVFSEALNLIMKIAVRISTRNLFQMQKAELFLTLANHSG